MKGKTMKKNKDVVYVVCETCNGEQVFQDVFRDKTGAVNYTLENSYNLRVGEKFVVLEREIF